MSETKWAEISQQYSTDYTRLVDEYKRVEKENAELKAANARYEFLKEYTRVSSADITGNHYWRITQPTLRGCTFDEAVDNEMKRMRGEQV